MEDALYLGVILAISVMVGIAVGWAIWGGESEDE